MQPHQAEVGFQEAQVGNNNNIEINRQTQLDVQVCGFLVA